MPLRDDFGSTGNGQINCTEHQAECDEIANQFLAMWYGVCGALVVLFAFMYACTHRKTISTCCKRNETSHVDSKVSAGAGPPFTETTKGVVQDSKADRKDGYLKELTLPLLTPTPIATLPASESPPLTPLNDAKKFKVPPLRAPVSAALIVDTSGGLAIN